MLGSIATIVPILLMSPRPATRELVHRAPLDARGPGASEPDLRPLHWSSSPWASSRLFALGPYFHPTVLGSGLPPTRGQS